MSNCDTKAGPDGELRVVPKRVELMVYLGVRL